MEIGVLVLIGLAIYAFTHSQAGGMTATLGPGGPGVRTGPAPQPGAQPGSQPGGAGAGVLGPGIEGVKRALNTARQQTPPGSVTPPANIPLADPETLQSISDSLGMTIEEFTSMAGQFGLAPEQLASVVSAGGSEFAQLATGGGVIGPVSTDTLTSVGGSAMGSFGAWAGPAAAALAIGAAVIMTAMQGEGINKSKDEQRARMKALGQARVYEIINAVLAEQLRTGLGPAWFTPQWMLANGFYMGYMDSAKDLWGQAALDAAIADKVAIIRSRDAANRAAGLYGPSVEGAWLIKAREFITQADQSWGSYAVPAPGTDVVLVAQGRRMYEGQYGGTMDPARYVAELLAHVPVPEWMWTASPLIRNLSAMGAAGAIQYLREQFRQQDAAVHQYVAEGGNA